MNNSNSHFLFPESNTINFHPIVPFDPETDQVSVIDLSPSNTSFTAEVYTNEKKFDSFVNTQLQTKEARYLIGGYGETRNMYLRSHLFDENLNDGVSEKDEPRNLHLGVDVWGMANTPIMAPLDGIVHSMANNNNFGDYGPTIILQHNLDNFQFYTLYGHLTVDDLQHLSVGQVIERGDTFAHFGDYNENGNWPPHLHFQIITAIHEWKGDYPGVCKASEADAYLANCPDPDIILGLRQFTA